MIEIEVSSDFAELWRYNIFATCGGFNAAGERLYVVGEEMISSEEIAAGVVPLPPAPVDFDPQSMTLRLSCDEAEQYRIIIYVVAHLLPEDRIVDNSPPFDCFVRVSRDGEEILREIYKVNQWGGLTANINL